MLVEPPRPHVPARHGLSALDLGRHGAIAAALVLAVTSRGDALVLAACLGLVAWRPVPAGALGIALTATSWRWGSTSLEHLAGAQAVLGPAGWVGPGRAAAGCWLAAGAVVVATTAGSEGLGRGWVALTAGAAAALMVAGPAPGGEVWVRVLGTGVAGLAALGAAGARRRSPRAPLVLDGLALAAAAGALLAVSPAAGPWAGTVSSDALRDGVAVAAASGALVPMFVLTVAGMGAYRRSDA